MTEKLYNIGDVAQIDPNHDAGFGGCFMLITEVRSWGVIGFVAVPERPVAKQAWYRVEFDHITRVGGAEWIPAAEPETA